VFYGGRFTNRAAANCINLFDRTRALRAIGGAMRLNCRRASRLPSRRAPNDDRFPIFNMIG
jgi:hypothetical protein